MIGQFFVRRCQGAEKWLPLHSSCAAGFFKVGARCCFAAHAHIKDNFPRREVTLVALIILQKVALDFFGVDSSGRDGELETALLKKHLRTFMLVLVHM